jgi:hypothetical protein
MISSDFNCTRIAGVCKPTNTNALAIVQEAQRQLNRIAQAKNLTKISVDGDVGPKMLTLAQKALGTGGVTNSVISLALNIDNVVPLAKSLADQAGVPQKISQPVQITTPSIIPPGASAPVPVPAAGGMFSGLGLSQTQMLILGGLGALIVYKKFIKKGRRK